MAVTLEISDGTTTINLLPREETGFHLEDWRPAIADLKGGGVYQESDIAYGRDLVFRQYETVSDTFNLVVDGRDQDGTIEKIQDLLRLLIKARDYDLSSWQDTPVYIIAQAGCETNARYALIKNFKIPELGNPYGQPFATAFELAGMRGFTLIIEHNHWQSTIPGNGDCTQVNTTLDQVQFEWSLNTTQPVGDIMDIIELSSGFMLACDNVGPEVWRNNTGGAVWTASTTPPTGLTRVFAEQGTWAYLGTSTGIFRSNDNGNNWALRNANMQVGTQYGLIAASDGYLYCSGDLSGVLGIHRSNDGGATWATVISMQLLGDAALMEASDGYIYAAQQSIWRSSNGTTWIEVLASTSPPIYDFSQLLETDDYLFALGEGAIVTEGIVYRSSNGTAWTKVASLNNGILDAIVPSFGGIMVSGGVVGTSMVAYGNDAGDKWQEFEAITGTNERFWSILQFSGNDNVYAGETGDIFVQVHTEITTGRSNTCNNENYIVNKVNLSQLTHIFVFDATGPTYTTQFPAAAFPFDLFPDPAAVGDIIYFGTDTSVLDTGPFCSLVFDIGTRLVAQGSNTFVWEYSQGGAAWNTLTVQDNTDSVYPFDKAGVNSVHWEQPSDWAADTVNSVTALWVRLRISAVGTWVTTPTQQNRDIYTTLLPRIDVSASQVLGDIPALLQAKLPNQSDKDGPGGSAPDLYSNRILAGLKSYSRGADFQAYINLADEQQPPGITVSAGTNTAFAADVTTPTGRRMTYNPAGVEAMATRATITFDSSVARDFYGVYHAFLRVQRTAGNSTDFDIQLQVSSGSGGVSYTTETQQVQTTTAFEVLDFGQIQMPVAGNLKLTELGDQSVIYIQASAASGTPNLNLYDLILIPTDEWSIDAVDKANESDSDIGRGGSVPKLLDIDSIGYPRETIRALVRSIVNGEFVTSIYRPNSVGKAILQANARQRLWFFAMQTSTTGDSFNWIAPPEISHSIQLFKAQRYLGLRGSR